jgi:probable HAF family extracellular repeat protein
MLAASAGIAHAQMPTFTDIGVLPSGALSGATALSAPTALARRRVLPHAARRACALVRIFTAAEGLRNLGIHPRGRHLAGDGAHSSDGPASSSARATNSNNVFPRLRWAEPGPMVDLGSLVNPGLSSVARAVNADGSVIVGDSGSNAFRWTAATGMVDLGTLPNATATSASARECRRLGRRGHVRTHSGRVPLDRGQGA